MVSEHVPKAPLQFGMMLFEKNLKFPRITDGAVAIWDDVVRKEFEIPKDYRLLCGIALGYPSDSAVNDFKANRIGVEELTVKPRNR